MQTTRLSLLTTILLGCGGGSGGPGDFDESPGTADDLREWAPSASAPSLYFNAGTPLLIAGLAAEDETCPAIVEDGTTTTYTGGCTDSSGNEWLGSAVASADGVDYDGFGFTGDVEACPGMRATFRYHGTMDTSAAVSGGGFAIDVTMEGEGYDDDCAPRTETIAIQYEGTIEDGGDADTYQGSGVIGSSLRGYVNVSTEAEVVDMNLCGTEALSGTTTITASGHTAVITYDGATDCDEASTVTWTYDGEDQGELDGVSCSAGGGAGGWAGLLVVAGALVIRRRRRR